MTKKIIYFVLIALLCGCSHKSDAQIMFEVRMSEYDTKEHFYIYHEDNHVVENEADYLFLLQGNHYDKLYQDMVKNHLKVVYLDTTKGNYEYTIYRVVKENYLVVTTLTLNLHSEEFNGACSFKESSDKIGYFEITDEIKKVEGGYLIKGTYQLVLLDTSISQYNDLENLGTYFDQFYVEVEE